jgi:hypothetical protein
MDADTALKARWAEQQRQRLVQQHRAAQSQAARRCAQQYAARTAKEA